MFPASSHLYYQLRRRLNHPLAHVFKESEHWVSKLRDHKVLIGVTVHTSTMAHRTVTLENMNQNIKRMEYAVRGPLVIRANEIEKELQKLTEAMKKKRLAWAQDHHHMTVEDWSKGSKKPFNEVIKANIGDCHAMGQKPLTFIRQVLTLCTYPRLMKDSQFPEDVKHRAEAILDCCAGYSVGAYSDSTGVDIIKKHVAQYIERRDGIPSDPQNIILSTGASEAVKSVLSLLNHSDTSKPAGIMIPIPQYPLYSATIAEYGMHQIGYYLDEDHDWALSIKELKRAVDEARKICEPRALVVINPGNPTGSVLTRKNIEEIIKFVHEEKLFLMADEVYQDNVYAEGMEFFSFKKVMIEMGSPYKDMELTSFMSASKGYMGECGLRGGYCELVNIDPEVKRMLLKAVSARLCSSVLGQATMDCIVNPPQKGEPSYEQFMEEKQEVLQSLKERALLVAKTFNNIPGMKCNKVAGAMYAFPRICLPEKAIEKAKSLGQPADFFYAMQLLENTGICVVPGSGFGQIPGTYHFRTTILPQTEKLKVMLKRLEEYHLKFLEEYK